MDRQKSISLLLGAGFSIPKGYPTGAAINDALLSFDHFSVSFSTSGELLSPGEKGPSYINDYQKKFQFCKQLIKQYKKEKGSFDYELFYDFIQSSEIYQPQYKRICEDPTDYQSYVFGIIPIYNQMVAYLLKDKYEKSWYEDTPSIIGPLKGYDGILKALQYWSKDYVINVHTLNHDLLFESFNKTEYLSGMISDGFDEYGSEYYGVLESGHTKYHVRLERYTGRYNTLIRLYKLHGSLDYVKYHKTDKYGILRPTRFIKIRQNISPINLLRCKGSKMKYERFPFTFHSDFLTGRTAKTSRYNDPFLFKKLFKRFAHNLHSAETLIIIGYSGRDSGINDLILKNFDFITKKVVIFDPSISADLKNFACNTKARIIKKSVENITAKDLLNII